MHYVTLLPVAAAEFFFHFSSSFPSLLLLLLLPFTSNGVLDNRGAGAPLQPPKSAPAYYLTMNCGVNSMD